MKLIRCLFALLFLSLFAGCSTNNIYVGPPIAEPATLDDALVTVTISDVPGFLDGAGGVASQVNPMANGPMMKALLGGQLGDPELKGFAPGKGLSLVVLDSETQFIVITHNRNTVQVADVIYGIIMSDDSSSQVLSLKLDEVDEVIDS